MLYYPSYVQLLFFSPRLCSHSSSSWDAFCSPLLSEYCLPVKIQLTHPSSAKTLLITPVCPALPTSFIAHTTSSVHDSLEPLIDSHLEPDRSELEGAWQSCRKGREGDDLLTITAQIGSRGRSTHLPLRFLHGSPSSVSQRVVGDTPASESRGGTH